MKRIVIKIGSNVLTRADGTLNVTRMSALVDQIASLRGKGWEVVVVSSGAVASGRSEVKLKHRLDSVAQRQVFSAVGQVKLLNHYFDLFREYGICVGQVLTTKEDFSTRNQYLNQRACINVMLKNGVLPIVNENDTVSITELMFTDNDELSGLIATMTEADMLIVLSNVDGIFSGNPRDDGAELIREVCPEENLERYISSEKSGFGRGGMLTKCSIAQKVAAEGIKVIIANGNRENILMDVLYNADHTPHTLILPSRQKASGVKKWVAHSGGFSKGKVFVNADAVTALAGEKAVSLLFVGVTRIEGDFERGDIVTILNPDGGGIALGKAEFSAEEARPLIGHHHVRPLVHYDYLYLE